MIRAGAPVAGPCHHQRIERPRLSYSTVSSAPPEIVVLCLTRQASRLGPASLVRESVIVVWVPSRRVPRPRRPERSFSRWVTSLLGSGSLVRVPNRGANSGKVLWLAAFTIL